MRTKTTKCPGLTALIGNPERPPLDVGEMALDSIRAHGLCPECNCLWVAVDSGVSFNRCITAAIKEQSERLGQ